MAETKGRIWRLAHDKLGISITRSCRLQFDARGECRHDYKLRTYTGK